MKLIISLFFLFFFGILQGQTIFLNRPSKTESAIVLEKGVFQIESAYETEIAGNSEEREKEILFPGVLLRYGLGWGIEMSVANQFETYKDKLISVNGFTDIDISVKIKLLKAKNKKTEIALISHLFLPTGSDDISNQRLENESLVLVYHELSEKIGIEYNLGFNNFEIDSDQANFVYSFVSDYEINDNFGFFIETYGELLELDELEASFGPWISIPIN
jgi:hypothetical protein